MGDEKNEMDLIEEEEIDTIDPIYQKFVRGITRAIGSTEFYEYFMDAVANSDNEIQFSNRKMVKTVDATWVNAVEDALGAIENIINTPRNVIKEEELIVNVANARKAGSETVRHLAQHSSLVEDFNYETGDVRPSKLMQRYREDSINLYENRLVYTTLEMAHHFVKIRNDALMEAMGDEFGAKLKLRSDMDSAYEHVHMDMYLHIKKTDSALDTDRKNADILGRISRVNRILSMFMGTNFSEQMSKLPRVRGAVNKTNVLKKNKNYKEVLKLFEFLRNYTDVGYTIGIREQNPVITEAFQEDIYRNILFNYIVLKGYLEDAQDRRLPVANERRQEFKPKVILEIIEEITKDYNIPDVEIRKILIEELTKEQLMQEEAAMRRRLVEEQEERRTEEEKLLAKQRRIEEERQRILDENYRELLEPELLYFTQHLKERLNKRIEDAQEMQYHAEKEDFADAAEQLEEKESRMREEAAIRRRNKLLSIYRPYMDELTYFEEYRKLQLEARVRQAVEQYHAEEERNLARKARRERKKSIWSGFLNRRGD